MPEPFKNLYNRPYLQNLADVLAQTQKGFDAKQFLNSVFDKEWEQRELKQRMRHITVCLHKHLPGNYPAQLNTLRAVAPQFSGFIAMLFPDFVEVYGLDAPDISIPALEFFTQFSSSEFAVRPFILKYEKRMVKQHLLWARHASHHVRRLASEGIRPRLPWAMALPAFKKDPSPILPILELLKQDESEYVRRSVANNLNDISKDHPELVLKIVKQWQGLSKETDRIVKHASRSLLKGGHTQALGSFGFNHALQAVVNKLVLKPASLHIGDDLTFSFQLRLTDKKKQRVRIEYAVYYHKSNGGYGKKVFKISEREMQPGETIEIKRKQSFKDLSTRRHYPGPHKLAIVINGKELAERKFTLK